MLQVHPDSICDICFDQYTFSSPAKSPHGIGCGHVFCLECLVNLNHPMSCPLCRKTFATNRITKLHVDRHVSGEREAVMPKAWSLVQHLSGCMRSDVDIHMTEERIKEARRWLEVGNRKALFPEVDAVSLALVQFMLYQERLHDLQATIAAFSARVESLQERFSDQQATITMFTVLIRSLQGRFHDQQATIAMFSVLIKSLQERLYYQQVMMASLTARLQREGTPRDDDRKEAPVEHDLTLKIEELEAQLDFYRHRFPGIHEPAQRHQSHVNSPTSEDRANSDSSLNNQGDPLPSPPWPICNPLIARSSVSESTGNSQEPYLYASVLPTHSEPYLASMDTGAITYEAYQLWNRTVSPSHS